MWHSGCRLSASPKAADGRVRVGLNVSGLLFNGGYTGGNMFKLKADYAVMTRSLIQAFLKLKNCEVHLVAHVVPINMPVEDDHLVSKQLQLEYPNVILAPRFGSPSQAKSYISGLDFFCGARMHACIAAFSSGVPVMPIAYSRKFAGVFGTLGYGVLADCMTMTSDEVVDATLRAFHDRKALKRDVETCQSLALERLDVYEAVVENLIGDIGGGRTGA